MIPTPQPSSNAVSQSVRHYEFDHLRVYAFGLLILYHVGMLFVADWAWHIKSPDTSEFLKYPMVAINRWRMPLLFLISGAGVYWSLARRRPLAFLGERWVRLFIPLLFGMFVVVVPQTYHEALGKGMTFTSLSEFYSWYLANEFTYNHLWFLPYVLLYCTLFLPLWVYGRTAIPRILEWFATPLCMILLLLPLILIDMLMEDTWPVTHDIRNDWFNFTQSAVIFAMGFGIAGSERFQELARRLRWRALLLAPLLYIGMWGIWLLMATSRHNFWLDLIDDPLNTLYGGTCLIAVLGFARQHLQHDSAFLRWTTPAIFPFYIAHQTITIWFGWYAKDWPLPLGLCFLLVTAATFLGCWLTYELVRRTKLTRVVFGLKA